MELKDNSKKNFDKSKKKKRYISELENRTNGTEKNRTK